MDIIDCICLMLSLGIKDRRISLRSSNNVFFDFPIDDVDFIRINMNNFPVAKYCVYCGYIWCTVKGCTPISEIYVAKYLMSNKHYEIMHRPAKMLNPITIDAFSNKVTRIGKVYLYMDDEGFTYNLDSTQNLIRKTRL